MVGTALDERMVTAATGTLELFAVHVGERLGLYEVLRERPHADAAELAQAAGIHERYAREWLEQQPSAALGTVLREGTLRSLASDAGYSSVEVLPVDGGFFRLYVLRP